MGEFVCCERCWHQTQVGVVEPKCSGCCLMLCLADFARVCVHAQLIVLPSLGSSASHSDKQLGAERSCRLGCSARHARGRAVFAPFRVSVCGSVLLGRWPRGTLKRRRPVGKCSKCQLPESDVQLNALVSIQHCCEWREVCFWYHM